MAMEWYRAYHNMPHDPKLQVVAKRAGQPMAFVVAVWVCILDAASQHDPRGIIALDPEEVAVIQGMELSAVEAILDALTSKNLIDAEGNVVNWHKRQHTTSTERSQKSRDKKKQDAAGSSGTQRGATAGNAAQRKNGKKSPDTDSDAETDADSDQRADSDSKTNSKNRERAEKRESEGEKPQIGGKDAEQNKTQILQQMADIWNEEVQSKLTNGNGQKAILTPKRKELLAARWGDEFAEDIRAWRYFCEIIGKSDFCLGKIEGKDWTIDLTWAIQSSDRVAKILEGGFSGGKHPSRPPSCSIPEFADAWDEVIKRMSHHHGPAAIRSWFSNSIITAAADTPDGVMLTLEVGREFVRGWIEKNYLTDLNHCWSDVACARPVIGVELKTKEATS